jgi:hypothetical protein
MTRIGEMEPEDVLASAVEDYLDWYDGDDADPHGDRHKILQLLQGYGYTLIPCEIGGS